MSFLLFLSAFALLIPMGAFGALLPGVRRLPWFSRLGAAFLCGAVLLTVEAVLFSLSGAEWSASTMIFVALVLNGVSIPILRRRGPETEERLVVRVSGAAFVIVVAASLHLTLMLATSRATSIDFTYFWGVKAVHFAEERGIDVGLLEWKWFAHAVPDYPPLVPVTQAFGVLIAGRMPWVGAPLTSAIWLGACFTVVVGILATQLPPRQAWSVGAFWYTAMALSITFSYSGANAEAPLLAFETAGGLGMFLAADDRKWWPFTALMLAGAAMTKVEAIVVILGLATGLVLKDVGQRAPAELVRRLTLLAIGPLFALVLWFGFQHLEGLPVGYRPHGELQTLYWGHLGSVLRSFPSNLAAGSWGLSWMIPLTIVVLSFPDGAASRRYYPMLTAVAALFGFFVFDYLHDPTDPWERIGWTLPRISQPGLSFLILTAGLMSFDPLSRARGPDKTIEPCADSPEVSPERD